MPSIVASWVTVYCCPCYT